MSNRELIQKLKDVACIDYDGQQTCLEAAAALEAMEWRTIEEAPDFDGETKVLVVGGRFKIPEVEYTDGEYWRREMPHLSAIPTHFMPLPPAPEEE